MVLAVVLLLVAATVDAAAQSAPISTAEAPPTAPADDPMAIGSSEWTFSGAAGWGVPVFGYGVDDAFVLPSVSWALMLTGPHGPGLLRGRFQWGIEAIPFFAQYEPERVFGAGFAPLIWRWNFEPKGRVSPFAELGGGLLWTNADLPPDTTGANYTAHVMLAVRLLGAQSHGALIGYRFEHISNGNRVRRNPSVNAHAVVVGWSLLR